MKADEYGKGVAIPPLNPVLGNRAAFLEQLANQAEEDEAEVGSEQERADQMRQVKATYEGGPQSHDDPEYFPPKSREQINRELRAQYGNTPGLDPEPKADEQTPSSTELETPPGPESASSAAEETISLVVRGKTILKPRAEVDEHGGAAIYQRELAADDYLQEARSILDEAKKFPRPPPEAPPAETQSEDDVEALARAIRIGTDEEATEAVRRLRTTTAAVDPNQIDLMVRNAIESREDANWFVDEYKDVKSDSRLFSALVAEDQQKWDAGDHRPRRERWKELGDAYRKYVKPGSPMEARRERKASTVTIPSASVRQPAAQVDEGPDDDRQAVIAQMRRARGQA